MKIIGLICLVLGLLAAVKAFNSEPPKQASEAYLQGRKIGLVTGPVVLLGLGLWLVLRDGSGRARPASARPRSVAGFAPPPMPPHVASMPVKIHCGCGQNYSFEVEPVAGQMPAAVTCPACGADGTGAANAVIAQSLAGRSELSPSERPRKLHPALLAGTGVVGLLVLAVAISLVVRLSARFGRGQQFRPRMPESSWTQPAFSPSPAERSNSPARRPGASPRTNPAQRGRPGTAREAAPVPPEMTVVEVFWGSRWWPATILRRDGQRVYIHYEGWSANFDEWVTPDRLRPR